MMIDGDDDKSILLLLPAIFISAFLLYLTEVYIHQITSEVYAFVHHSGAPLPAQYVS